MDKDEILEWALDKHRRMALVIPVASKDPWSLHENENVCVGCLPTFVSEYLADIPEAMELIDEEEENGEP